VDDHWAGFGLVLQTSSAPFRRSSEAEDLGRPSSIRRWKMILFPRGMDPPGRWLPQLARCAVCCCYACMLPRAVCCLLRTRMLPAVLPAARMLPAAAMRACRRYHTHAAARCRACLLARRRMLPRALACLHAVVACTRCYCRFCYNHSVTLLQYCYIFATMSPAKVSGELSFAT
jgi:hypothetical protein